MKLKTYEGERELKKKKSSSCMSSSKKISRFIGFGAKTNHRNLTLIPLLYR